MESSVGIIFLFGNSVFIDSTPVSSAIPYGDLRTHEKGHPDYWQELQSHRAVPTDVEYDEVARGRVTWNPRKGIALLMLDRCILSRPDLVEEIRERMHLPGGTATEVSRDSHYFCPGCRPQPKDDDEDW